MRVEKTIVVDAPVSKTYKTAEEYPLFVSDFVKKEILLRTDTVAKVRISNRFFFVTLTWEGDGIKSMNRRIDWIQTTGLLSGLKAAWVFVPLAENVTKVTIKGEYLRSDLRGLLLSTIAPMLIGKAAAKILVALKSETECSR